MPSLLIIDDDRSILSAIRQGLRDCPITVHSGSTVAEGLELFDQLRPDVVVLDMMLPDQTGLAAFSQIHERDRTVSVIFLTADATAHTAIEAMKLGAMDFLLKPIQLPRLRELIDQALRIHHFVHVPVYVADADAADPASAGDPMIGRCPAMQEIYKAIGRVAPQNVNVLIRGESGTGKELVARAIFQHSRRSRNRFLAVNCAAIPETLLESELFGHEKGSFTGADSKRIGKFEQCSHGTLFLDEIGDMTPAMQSKVLRALQEQRFERVGGLETIQTDVRILAATNRNLEQMVAEGSYRADLYYRLNGFTIELPALRQRVPDIPLLVESFLARFCRELNRPSCGVSPAAMELLERYCWPGNIRELQSVLKRALLHAPGRVLLGEYLPEELAQPAPHPGQNEMAKPGEPPGLDEFLDLRLRDDCTTLYADSIDYVERIVLTEVLRRTRANQSRAAKVLGITRGSLRNKIRHLGISISPEVNVDEDLKPVAMPRRIARKRLPQA